MVWSGKLLYEIDRGAGLEKIELGPGQRIHVSPKTIHRMTAIEDSDIFPGAAKMLASVAVPMLIGSRVVALEDDAGLAAQARQALATALAVVEAIR